jgi:hypothetical protein
MCMRYGKDVRATAEHLDVALVSISSIKNGQVFRRFVDAGFPNPPYLCRALRRMPVDQQGFPREITRTSSCSYSTERGRVGEGRR